MKNRVRYTPRGAKNHLDRRRFLASGGGIAFQSLPVNAAHARARELYDAEVRFVDFEFGKVLRLIEDLGIYDDTLLVVTSDHGQEFWEHGSHAHGGSLYDEVLRVPLIIKPRSGNTPLSCGDLVSIESLVPTITDLARSEPVLDTDPDLLPGRSLRQAVKGDTYHGPPLLATSVLRGEDQIAVRFDR